MRTISACIFIGLVIVSGIAIAQERGRLPMPTSDRIPSSLMTFFVTSEPIGDGGNLGGLAGADAHCQKLATAAGAGSKTWRAYLSKHARPRPPAGTARQPL